MHAQSVGVGLKVQQVRRRLNVILLPFLGVQRIRSKASIPLLLKGIVNDFPFSMRKAGGAWHRCSMTVRLAYRFERTK